MQKAEQVIQGGSPNQVNIGWKAIEVGLSTQLTPEGFSTYIANAKRAFEVL